MGLCVGVQQSWSAFPGDILWVVSPYLLWENAFGIKRTVGNATTITWGLFFESIDWQVHVEAGMGHQENLEASSFWQRHAVHANISQDVVGSPSFHQCLDHCIRSLGLAFQKSSPIPSSVGKTMPYAMFTIAQSSPFFFGGINHSQSWVVYYCLTTQ